MNLSSGNNILTTNLPQSGQTILKPHWQNLGQL